MNFSEERPEAQAGIIICTIWHKCGWENKQFFVFWVYFFIYQTKLDILFLSTYNLNRKRRMPYTSEWEEGWVQSEKIASWV